MVLLDATDMAIVRLVKMHLDGQTISHSLAALCEKVAKGLIEGNLASEPTPNGNTSPERETADLLLQCYCIALDNYCGGALLGNDRWMDFGGISWQECSRRAVKWSHIAYTTSGISRWNMPQTASWPEDEFDLN